jgi:multimeric flavodoxin WrbA
MGEKLKIVVIYSNARKESTYNCVKIFKEALQKENDVDFTEFTLPGDMPHICLGCFSCFEKGEDKCPHASSVQPIVNAILESDGIILSSPVYSLDASCAIKSLLDHMCYLWISHRPHEEMFNKTAMVISTTAGAGVRTSVKTLKKSPRYWGVKRVYGFGRVLRASRWEQVSNSTKSKIAAELAKKAKQFNRAIMNKDKLKQRLFIRLLFPFMGKMIGGYEPDSLLHKDTKYWRQKGWLNESKPF